MFSPVDGKHPGCDQSYIGRREFSFSLSDDRLIRFLSFNTLSELERSIKEKCPIKIDIGPVYSVDVWTAWVLWLLYSMLTTIWAYSLQSYHIVFKFAASKKARLFSRWCLHSCGEGACLWYCQCFLNVLCWSCFPPCWVDLTDGLLAFFLLGYLRLWWCSLLLHGSRCLHWMLALDDHCYQSDWFCSQRWELSAYMQMKRVKYSLMWKIYHSCL